MTRLRLRLTRMAGLVLDDQGRLWVRDDRLGPGSQQPRRLMRICGGCKLPAGVVYLRHRDSRELPEARCELCVRVVPG